MAKNPTPPPVLLKFGRHLYAVVAEGLSRLEFEGTEAARPRAADQPVPETLDEHLLDGWAGKAVVTIWEPDGMGHEQVKVPPRVSRRNFVRLSAIRRDFPSLEEGPAWGLEHRKQGAKKVESWLHLESVPTFKPFLAKVEGCGVRLRAAWPAPAIAARLIASPLDHLLFVTADYIGFCPGRSQAGIASSYRGYDVSLPQNLTSLYQDLVANSSSVPSQAPSWLIVGTPADIALLPTWAEPYPELDGLVNFWKRMIPEPMGVKQVTTQASFMSWPTFATQVWKQGPADPANLMAGFPRAFNVDDLFAPVAGASVVACLAAGWLVWSTLGAITLLNTQSQTELNRLNEEIANFRQLGEKSKRIESNLALADRFVSSHRLAIALLKNLGQKLPLEFTLTQLDVTADGEVRGTCLQVGSNGSPRQLKTSLEALALHDVQLDLPAPPPSAASAPQPSGAPVAEPKTRRGDRLPFSASLVERKKT
ncbi:MAG: hypothetical protein H2172_07375 [Opitutus sp.]|nr:hypothetical protein [Opitutus sp.]MCS6246597.1 hypothetical protein [Opitutus sp.]MCS6274588.1 hypothetical protein [Opitutus sp.]MCS6276067.1 hypothetical protein [Opitutus sp.]MCS6301163.1 hypothetical protein [Opitutus sp.]